MASAPAHGRWRLLDSLCALALLWGAPAWGAPPAPPQVDLHLDTPTQLLLRKLPLDSPTLEAGTPKLRAGGTNIAVMVIWPGQKVDPLVRSRDLMRTTLSEIARLPDVELATDPQAARRIAAEDKLAVLLSMEGAQGLGEGDWRATLDEFYGQGLRLLGLTWSHSNRFAGSSGDQGGGLTEEGRALVATARQRQIVLDVSHASRAATLEVCRGASGIPVIASHSDAHAVHAAARNLTDEELRCICATGGVVGLNLHATFVGPQANVERVADHAVHIANIGGKRCVALGSDFDGYIQKPAGLPDASALPALFTALERRGWTAAELDGLRGENFLSAWSLVQFK